MRVSKREIHRRYAKLMERIDSDDYHKSEKESRVNCYICPNGHVTKTIDLDDGTTPSGLACEECGARAHSTFYKDVVPTKNPTQEWYRPDLKKILKLQGEMLEHVLLGGLMIRKIEKL